MNKKIILFLFVLLSISFISANNYTTDTHGVDLSQSNPSGAKVGVRILTNNFTLAGDLGFKLTNVTADKRCHPSMAYLQDKNHVELMNVSTIETANGHVGIFNYNLLYNTTYYILFDNKTAVWEWRYRDISALGIPFPWQGININWTASGTDGTGDIFAVTNITTNRIQSIDYFPSTYQDFPVNDTNQSSAFVWFNCSATDDQMIQNISLYINGILNHTFTDGVDNVTNLTRYLDFGRGNDGKYNWSCQSVDNSTIMNRNMTGNRTFTIDTESPYFTNLANISGNASQKIQYDYNATDVLFSVDTFSINDSTNFNITREGILRNIELLKYGEYWLNLSVNDSLNNINSSIILINITAYYNWTFELDSQLIAYWNFSSGVETMNGGSWNLTNHTGKVDYVDFSKIGRAGYFEATKTDSLYVENSTYLGLNRTDIKNFTLAGWIYINDTTINNFFLYQNASFYQEKNLHRFYVTSISNPTLNTSDTTIIPVPFRWYHIGITRNDTNSCLWINGTLWRCEPSNLAGNTSSVNFLFGGTEIFDEWFGGYMDEWGFWKRDLNWTDFRILVNGGLGLTRDGFSADITNPNLTIHAPANLTSQASTSVFINATIEDDGTLYSCSYNVSKGAGTEIVETSLPCNSFNTTATLSGTGTYIFHFTAEDGAGNMNITAHQIEITGGGGLPPGGGGGPTTIIKIIGNETFIEAIKPICQNYDNAVSEIFKESKEQDLIKNIIENWRAIANQGLCKSLASIIPLDNAELLAEEGS